MNIFLNDWAESGLEGMKSDFAINSEQLEGAEILIASYTYEDYTGDAFVLFRRDGKLYEVNGGHCSCFGLGAQDVCGGGGTQWEPEETTVSAVRQRLGAGYAFEGMRVELGQVLDALEPQA